RRLRIRRRSYPKASPFRSWRWISHKLPSLIHPLLEMGINGNRSNPRDTMLAFTLRRFFHLIPILLGVSLLTFLLMLVIIRVSQGAKETGWFAGIAIGSVVLLEAMFAGPICGASMNPARSLAPAIVSGNIGQVWIYLIAPVLGALLAVFVGKTVFLKSKT
ncbi:MAG: aquaporin, partial [Phycisphaerae bacterium]|nr:aquaporin [Saprospiraceae bacterium]